MEPVLAPRCWGEATVDFAKTLGFGEPGRCLERSAKSAGSDPGFEGERTSVVTDMRERLTNGGGERKLWSLGEQRPPKPAWSPSNQPLPRTPLN